MSELVPVNAHEIALRSYQRRFHIEDKVAASLVEVINQGIKDKVTHGLLEYEFHVPSFIYGFPCFNVVYVHEKLRQAYRKAGFKVLPTKHGTLLRWEATPPPGKASSASASASAPPPPDRKPVLLGLAREGERTLARAGVLVKPQRPPKGSLSTT